MVGFFHKNDILLPSSEIWSSRCETQHWINRRIHPKRGKYFIGEFLHWTSCGEERLAEI
jgi:hypothetical protein